MRHEKTRHVSHDPSSGAEDGVSRVPFRLGDLSGVVIWLVP